MALFPGSFYERYLQSAEWQLVRAMKFRQTQFTCADCGYRRFPYKWGMLWRLEVHHLTYKRLGHERMEDLLVLCEPCHAKRHHLTPLSHASGFWSIQEILLGKAG